MKRPEFLKTTSELIVGAEVGLYKTKCLMNDY